jgi:S-adenosylmethionine hydrolase
VAGSLQGKVVSIGNTGNLVTDITSAELQGVPTDDRVSITCDGHTTNGIFPPDHKQPEMTLLALVGEGGQLELTIVGQRASEFLGIQPGASVVVQW